MNLLHTHCCFYTGSFGQSLHERLKSKICSLPLYYSPMYKPHWLSKPGILGTHLSGAGPKRGGAWLGAQTPCSSEEKTPYFWYPSQVLVTTLGVGVLREILSLLQKSCWVSFQVFLRGNAFICSCWFALSVGGVQCLPTLPSWTTSQ